MARLLVMREQMMKIHQNNRNSFFGQCGAGVREKRHFP